MNIKPLADRVMVKMLEAEETTKVVLFCSQQKRKTASGRNCGSRPGRDC